MRGLKQYSETAVMVSTQVPVTVKNTFRTVDDIAHNKKFRVHSAQRT